MRLRTLDLLHRTPICWNDFALVFRVTHHVAVTRHVNIADTICRLCAEIPWNWCEVSWDDSTDMTNCTICTCMLFEIVCMNYVYESRQHKIVFDRINWLIALTVISRIFPVMVIVCWSHIAATDTKRKIRIVLHKCRRTRYAFHCDSDHQ